jgi:hypothetical protein
MGPLARVLGAGEGTENIKPIDSKEVTGRRRLQMRLQMRLDYKIKKP